MMTQLLFIGTTELMLIAGMALLLFGGKKLPEMMKGLGQGVQSFKKGRNEPRPAFLFLICGLCNIAGQPYYTSGIAITYCCMLERAIPTMPYS